MKLYVVQKYVYAKSIPDVLKRERDIAPDDVYLDGDWRRKSLDTPPEREMGFKKK